MADPSEAGLVERARAGDMAAWGRLYQLSFHGLYRHICYLTGDDVLAEDLAQETFALAQASLPRFEGRAAFSTWLHGVAINVVRKQRERGRKAALTRERLDERREVIPQNGDLEREHLQRVRTETLYRVVDTLPDSLKYAFLLHDLAGIGVAEAAAQLGITEANLRVRAHRARVRVHELLAAEGWIAVSKETP